MHKERTNLQIRVLLYTGTVSDVNLHDGHGASYAVAGIDRWSLGIAEVLICRRSPKMCDCEIHATKLPARPPGRRTRPTPTPTSLWLTVQLPARPIEWKKGLESATDNTQASGSHDLSVPLVTTSSTHTLRVGNLAGHHDMRQESAKHLHSTCLTSLRGGPYFVPRQPVRRSLPLHAEGGGHSTPAPVCLPVVCLPVYQSACLRPALPCVFFPSCLSQAVVAVAAQTVLEKAKQAEGGGMGIDRSIGIGIQADPCSCFYFCDAANSSLSCSLPAPFVYCTHRVLGK